MSKKMSRDFNSMGMILIGLGLFIGIVGIISMMAGGAVSHQSWTFSRGFRYAFWNATYVYRRNNDYNWNIKKFLGSIGKESSYIAKETAPATEISTEAWAKGLAKGIKKGLRK